MYVLTASKPIYTVSKCETQSRIGGYSHFYLRNAGVFKKRTKRVAPLKPSGIDTSYRGFGHYGSVEILIN